MPTSAGLFDSFDNLDTISLEAIASWLKPVPDLTQLENYLANRILYPQTLPISEREMQIDLAILREALKINKDPFLDNTLRRMLIPAKFLNYVPDPANLTLIFIDALLLSRDRKDSLKDIWTVALTSDVAEVIGSAIMPQFNNGSGGVMSLSLFNKKYDIKQGNLMVIPCPKDRCEISYKLQNGHLLGKQDNAVEVYGGRLGLLIDGRNI